MPHPLKLPLSALKSTIDLSHIRIDTTTNSPNLLGQSRAQSALQFGVAMQAPGYNIYVMGDSGTGRLSMVTNYLKTLPQQTPDDYAYVDNFDNQREPVAIRLPAGEGEIFNKDIEKLIDDLLATFPAVFESPSYQQKKAAIERVFNQRYNAAIELVEKKARAYQIAAYQENDTMTFAPIKDNKPIDEEGFALLPQPERDIFNQQVEELEHYLSEVLLELPQWRRETVVNLKQLDQSFIVDGVAPLFTELNQKYINIDDIVSYLSEIEKDLSESIIELLIHNNPLASEDNRVKRQLLKEQYCPNVLMGHDVDCETPIVYEPHPTYQNLFGRIEYVSDQGMLTTNYQRICAGSLHKANGGYLIVDAEKLLTYPLVWESLKRALQSARIEIETPYSEFGVNTITLKPEVIPLNIKIIIIGGGDWYYALQDYDEDFNELFRVLADFDEHIQSNDTVIQQFAQLMLKQAQHSGFKPLTHQAISRLIEHSYRQAEDQQRLSAHINESLEIITEANLLAQQQNSPNINYQQIEQALTAREYRNGRIAERILEEMLDGTILIDTDGTAIGKINGLTVLSIGGSSFGAPARITTTVYPGSRGIVDIEREAELGQSIHSKGVLILTGYLGYCYAQQFSLAISASIAMEQSYGYIDGDSASLAELCCLISALTRTPIYQHFAITGSINQYGEVQAIGGVNEKIEGFFRLCEARQLTGLQGVIIPKANQRNLMLNQAVINAVEQGKFAIYSVSTVNETLELLTGCIAGELDDEGNYPENSINQQVIIRLKEISEMGDDDGKEEKQEESEEQ